MINLENIHKSSIMQILYSNRSYSMLYIYMHEITIALKEEVISLEKNNMSIRDGLEGRKERETMQV